MIGPAIKTSPTYSQEEQVGLTVIIGLEWTIVTPYDAGLNPAKRYFKKKFFYDCMM